MCCFALYSRKYDEPQPIVGNLISYLKGQGHEICAHDNICCDGCEVVRFHDHESLSLLENVDFMVSVGGDGSFIDAANIVGNLNIPLVGINTGRIGFLSAIRKENYEECFRMLQHGDYSLEERSLLHISGSKTLPLKCDFVVNDVTVRATDSDSINAIKVMANGRKVNTYWADGLIIATPTGSTAYSMSCGGPILHPQTDVMVLTPIASHALNVRPLVISAAQDLQIKVEGRAGKYSLCVDTQRLVLNDDIEIYISKEQFTIKTVLFNNNDFYSTIREKLLWGLDKRNN